jgi:catalase
MGSNTPKVPVHSYSKDAAMRIHNVSDPVYAPNSYDGPQADPDRAAGVGWHADGAWCAQPHLASRRRLGRVADGVKEPVLSRVFEYWRNVDPDLGKKVEEGVSASPR